MSAVRAPILAAPTEISLGRDKLLRYLSEKGRTARALAKLVGCRPSAISMLCSGAHAHPSLPLAVALERVAGIPCWAWVEPRSKFTPVNADEHRLSTMPNDNDKHPGSAQ